MSKKEMKRFVKEFDDFKEIWDDGRSANPINISEEFALIGFEAYKKFANCTNQDGDE